MGLLLMGLLLICNLFDVFMCYFQNERHIIFFNFPVYKNEWRGYWIGKGHGENGFTRKPKNSQENRCWKGSRETTKLQVTVLKVTDYLQDIEWL